MTATCAGCARSRARSRRECKLLKEFKGIGDVGANIFCREAQIAWDELYPFADRKALVVSQEARPAGKRGSSLRSSYPARISRVSPPRWCVATSPEITMRSDEPPECDETRPHFGRICPGKAGNSPDRR
jgi:hypothetical protein